jgi:hypothetical protein
MKLFKTKEHLPRIAFKVFRDGTRLYFVETWKCYESGCYYSQDSKEVKTLKEAEKIRKEISDKEVVEYRVIIDKQEV